MSPSFIVLIGSGLVLAFVNGANDVSKGIATLVGSGVTDYRKAILWGSVWTGIGGLLGGVLATSMVSTFGGGLLAASTVPTMTAAMATLIGAAGWVLVATWTGLPVSTTHAIVGSLAGVASLAYGIHGISWTVLAEKIALPLLVSPLVALALVALLLRVGGGAAKAWGRADQCVCMELSPRVLAVPAGASMLHSVLRTDAAELGVARGTTADCTIHHAGALRVTLDHMHWLTSGAVSLARGMNDAPKIVALVVGAAALGTSAPMPFSIACLWVTAGMIAGSLIGGLRVARVLAEKITAMDHREGFIANLVTAGLVATGATMGLPMSTTHVSSAGIFSIGAARGSLDRNTIRDIALAWVVTLPVSASLGMVAYLIGRSIT